MPLKHLSLGFVIDTKQLLLKFLKSLRTSLVAVEIALNAHLLLLTQRLMAKLEVRSRQFLARDHTTQLIR